MLRFARFRLVGEVTLLVVAEPGTFAIVKVSSGSKKSRWSAPARLLCESMGPVKSW